MLTATINISPLAQKIHYLEGLIEHESIPVVADSHKKRILGLTASGADAMGAIFHAYSPSQAKAREAMGFPTDIKTLRMSKGRLYDLELEGNLLTVKDTTESVTSKNGKTRSVSSRTIALGQMTGAGGRWGYKHNFLNASIEGNEIAGRELAQHIKALLF